MGNRIGTSLAQGRGRQTERERERESERIETFSHPSRSFLLCRSLHRLSEQTHSPPLLPPPSRAVVPSPASRAATSPATSATTAAAATIATTAAAAAAARECRVATTLLDHFQSPFPPEPLLLLAS